MKEYLPYQGVEQGPIRPPNEANSLLIRMTRNCSWNHCIFCPVYKDTTFSLRSVEDVKKDIDTIANYVEIFQEIRIHNQQVTAATFRDPRLQKFHQLDFNIVVNIANWVAAGMKTVFLQDANSLVIKPKDLIEMLYYLRLRFPQIQRITSYARSHTIANMKIADLHALQAVGLNRIHIGLESGADRVLALMQKGATQAIHINAGLKVKEADMELSEYYMPGLGGQEFSTEHALESAATLNQINPHFIRLRTLAIPAPAPLCQQSKAARFAKCTDLQVVQEMLLFLQNLQHVTSILKSDHILNLFPFFEGKLPEDKEKLLEMLEEFLQADCKRQQLYQIGRRCGILTSLRNLDNPQTFAKMQEVYQELGVTAENVDAISEALAQRYI